MRPIYNFLFILSVLACACLAAECTGEWFPENCEECEGLSTCVKCKSGFFTNPHAGWNIQCLESCPPPTIPNYDTMECEACPSGLSKCIVHGDDEWTCHNASETLCCPTPGNGDTYGEVCPGLEPEYSCCEGYKRRECNKNSEQYCCGDERKVSCPFSQGCCGAWPHCMPEGAQCCPLGSVYGHHCLAGQICTGGGDDECANCEAGTFVNTTSQTCDSCPENCQSCSDAHSCTQCESGFKLTGGRCELLSQPSQCAVAFEQTIDNSWNNGVNDNAQISVVLKNTGSKVITQISFTSNQVSLITSQWGVTKANNQFKLPSWVSSIPVGSSLSFGYIVRSGSPVEFHTTQLACSN